MTPIFIRIWLWVMQPEVWRFVGFASAVVGLVCYALSSSFNYLFGDWNLLKIILYCVFSFIICSVILFAKVWQHSRSLRFKAHATFLVLTITSLYSFFFDKVVNGKPDAYSLISCAAFAIMSLSLSRRKSQCGFEIELLYFFVGCLLMQLMKIKLVLFTVGACFSYLLVILRYCFSSMDVVIENEHPMSLQDENSHVVIEVHSDSPQLVSTNTMVEDRQQHQLQQLPQLMEEIQDQEMPQLKDMNMKMPPGNQNPNMKSVEFNMPEENDLYDDELDEYTDDEFVDEMEHNQIPNMKAAELNLPEEDDLYDDALDEFDDDEYTDDQYDDEMEQPELNIPDVQGLPAPTVGGGVGGGGGVDSGRYFQHVSKAGKNMMMDGNQQSYMAYPIRRRRNGLSRNGLSYHG